MNPYSDTLEHLLDELRRLDLLLELRLEEWRAENGGTVDEFRGLYVSDDEVDRLLRSHRDGGRWTNHDGGPRATNGRTRGDPALLARIEGVAREIHGRTLRTREEGTELRLDVLSERFELGPAHRDALLIALAPELDRKYERVYSYLRDDVTKTRPTVDLVLRVLCATEAERLEARRLFSRRSPLLRRRILRFSGGEEAPLPSRSLLVDERITGFLLGGDDLDEDLAGFAELRRPETRIDDLTVAAEQREMLERWVEKEENRQDRGSKPLMAYFYGPYGSAAEAAAEALCAESGTPLLTVDAGAMSKGTVSGTSRVLVREALLQRAALYVRDLSSLSGERDAELEALLRALDAVPDRVFLSGREPLPPRLQVRVTNHDLAVLEFPVPPYELRRELWDGVDSLPEDVNTADVASKFRLTAGQIEDAVSLARIHANGRGLSVESVYHGCRAQSGGTLDSLARKIEPSYGWDDIVLPADALDQLREVAARIEHRGVVYSEWGFGEKFSLGNGLIVLFAGPSGTGKTMAAEIVASEVGLDLYKIDLSGVVSKYIGETEKNLGKIFDAARDSSAILLFDEADALFGKRSAVKDAHDRYANVEVNYLLQRIEEHDGTVILTTNFKKNIDDAFSRRIHVSVDFPLPDRDARESIWQGVFPEETPLDELDVELLASVEMTGGNIKNVGLTAAFMAADDAGMIEMTHVLRAVRREFKKTGRLIASDTFKKPHDSTIQ